MKLFLIHSLVVILCGVSRGDPIVNFAIAPPGNPTTISAGDSLFITFSVFNSTSNPLFLYTAGLTVACTAPPCPDPPPIIIFNDLGVGKGILGPGTGLLPGSLFTDVLFTVVFPVPTEVWITPRVNFSGFQDNASDINGPTFKAVVTPEPATGMILVGGMFILIGLIRRRKRELSGPQQVMRQMPHEGTIRSPG
jgi:hypothetical protein